MNVEAVSFDATGTLFHCPSLAELYARSLQRHGVDLSTQEVARLFPMAWRELDCTVQRGGDRFADHPRGAKGFWEDLLQRLCVLGEQQPPGPFAAAELYQVFARGSSWELFPEVESVLAQLASEGLRLAVISNWDERLDDLLAELGVAAHFEVTISSSSVGHAKPDRRIFGAALGKLGLEPVQVLHVGDDRINDFEGAAAAGLQSFLVDRSRGIDLEDAAARVRSAQL